MAYYLVQIAYAPEAWVAMVKNPHMHLEDLRPLLERLGGKLEGCWLALGEFDAVLICQLPDQASAAALSVASSAKGGVRTIKTTPLMTASESFDALQKAAGTNEHTSYASPTSEGLPAPRSKQVDYKEILSARLRKFKERMGKMLTGG